MSSKEITRDDFIKAESEKTALFGMVNQRTEIDYANAVEFLACIPRFLRKKKNWARFSEVDTAVVKFETTHDNIDYEIQMSPATIERKGKDGDTEEVFIWPGDREEKVEAAIMRIASDGGLLQANGRYQRDDNRPVYGCYFSVHRIQKELEKIGKSAHPDDIKEAIEVMSKSALQIRSLSGNGQDVQEFSSAVFPQKYISGKATGHRDDKCYVTFHPLLNAAIEAMRYRPYQFAQVEMQKGLSRYIHMRLMMRFTYAAAGKTYSLRVRKLLNDYGKLPASEVISRAQLNNCGRDVNSACNKLVDSKVLQKFTKTAIRKDGEIVDYEITFYPHEEFNAAQLQNNKLNKMVQATGKVQSETVIEHKEL
ncbi:hypothetical protein HUZ36_14420 [Pseudoalteromonas sp. McH1-7]|uniref:Replication protein n=1 Tax=Pseudoalteromonas peptidolytica F12-50-A1 TaxID=1315280 RepID=A0A8I0T608_9GAMM|nr:MULTISPECIES: hypothetical protein [Pseudoalteromonas]MBE0347823.1 hypothetical protein [Pseudoalteromonas peptidolytica F12-50-A1]MDW7551258.1 hypothetical protein [Pseudoalteromonas peptidolytica]NLR15269.1 hypothetical protein [Pseudoalteromonas peptidolytica]NUZ11980.1 hypothetical protein [Pseudoalteromonas sp. McH1-7]RXF01042.1 hypothetical protein D9603_14165 [Pseudoalteromonas sp. PS5]